MTRSFVARTEQFAEDQGVDLVTFATGQRKDDVAQEYLPDFSEEEGVLFVGKAQEKASVFRTIKKITDSGLTFPWLIRSTAMVNHYYFYLVDKAVGPFFIKFCSYFPFAVKVCINGNEWLKRQLDKRGIAYEALDNGIRWCEDPEEVQRIAHCLNEYKIEKLFRKWLPRLPHAFSSKIRRAGSGYRLSILQAEFCLTQVLERPLAGRCFFEEVIRENLDIGRPDKVQLIFNRRVTRQAASPRVLQEMQNQAVPHEQPSSPH